jgi:uncharacterized protein YndB with AHSA1/START domain
MKELRSEIEIQASEERVWQLLTDFASFPQWNPFIRRASGEAKAGSRLEVYIQPTGAGGMTSSLLSSRQSHIKSCVGWAVF